MWKTYLGIHMLPGHSLNPGRRTSSAFLVIAGIVLFIGGAAKLLALHVEPVAVLQLGNRGNLAVIIAIELLLAMAIFTGWRRSAVRLASVALFLVFTTMALRNIVSGAASCGCLGVLHLNPYGMALLNATVLCLLLAARIPSDHARAHRRFPIAAGAVIGIVAVGTLIARAPHRIDVSGVRDGDVVVLDPASWRGQSFPLSRWLDINKDLTIGKWVVVLFNYNCSLCVQKLNEIQHDNNKNGNGRLALLELPPYARNAAAAPAVPAAAAAIGRLKDGPRWICEIPTTIHLDNGVVTRVTIGKEAN